MYSHIQCILTDLANPTYMHTHPTSPPSPLTHSYANKQTFKQKNNTHTHTRTSHDTHTCKGPCPKRPFGMGAKPSACARTSDLIVTSLLAVPSVPAAAVAASNFGIAAAAAAAAAATAVASPAVTVCPPFCSACSVAAGPVKLPWIPSIITTPPPSPPPLPAVVVCAVVCELAC